MLYNQPPAGVYKASRSVSKHRHRACAHIFTALNLPANHILVDRSCSTLHIVLATMKRWAVLLLAAVAVLGVAQAARMPAYDSIMQEIDTLGDFFQEPFFGKFGTARLRDDVGRKKKSDMALITAR
jgi:hypothetical protein